MATAPTLRGRVTAFDDHAGHGTVTLADGDEVFFHCVAIADGTRTIAVGTEVDLRLVAGRLGRWEGADLRPVPGRAG